MAEYQVGKIVKGCVTGIEKYGIFVSLDNFYSGLIHISEISSGFVRNVADYVTVGETIYVKVLDVDDTEFKLKLSIKDIKYKLEKPRDTHVIIESGSGFEPLKLKLDEWIKDKIKEMG